MWRYYTVLALYYCDYSERWCICKLKKHFLERSFKFYLRRSITKCGSSKLKAVDQSTPWTRHLHRLRPEVDSELKRCKKGCVAELNLHIWIQNSCIFLKQNEKYYLFWITTARNLSMWLLSLSHIIVQTLYTLRPCPWHETCMNQV